MIRPCDAIGLDEEVEPFHGVFGQEFSRPGLEDIKGFDDLVPTPGLREGEQFHIAVART